MNDSAELHIKDTLAAGKGFGAIKKAVRILAQKLRQDCDLVKIRRPSIRWKEKLL